MLELVWVRLLGLVLGSTSLAIATTLGVFMGGLALGSRIIGPRADRIRRPLLGYAVCELVIGAYALCAPALIEALPGLVGTFGDSYASLAVGRFVGAALVLLVPTTLMGATLPLLLRHVVPPGADARAATRLGALYAANTGGAVAGVFLAGFVLLPSLGVRATNRVAALVDLAIFLVVAAFGRRPPAPAPDLSAGEAPAPPPLEHPGRGRHAVLGAIFVAGASAMVLEVLWSRALAIVLGSSIYSFTIILLTFLSGLALGAALCARTLARSPRPLGRLALALGATAGLTFGSYLLCDKLPLLFLALLGDPQFDVDAVLWSQWALAAALLLPPTIPMGAVLPLAIRALAPPGDRLGRDVGRAYALNTLGAIAGSLLGGFVVLPGLGVERGLLACVAAGFGVAAALALAAPELGRARRALCAGGLALLAALVPLAAPRWALARFSYGLFRVSIARDILASGGKWKMPELLYYRDGIGTTVSVERWEKTIAIKNNGKVDASNDADMPTQIAVGLLPLLVAAPERPTVALVGYGSGVTAGGILAYPVARLDVVELEPAIVEAATRFFDDVNGRPLADPRTQLYADDGRNFLVRAPGRYDLIVSQPSNPWITGVSNLFTREYFEIVKARLAPGGLFCQWAQLYEIHPLRIKSILATLRGVFPHAYVFAAEDLSSDVIIVASDRPFPIDRGRIERALAAPRTRAEAARAGLRSAEDVLAYLLLTPEELESFSAGAPANTDDTAYVEFSAPRDLLGRDRTTVTLAKIYGDRWPYGRLEGAVTGLDAPETRGRLARSLIAHGRLREARRAIAGAPDVPDVTRARRLLELAAGGAEPPLDRDALDPPRLPPGLPPARLEELTRDYAAVERLVDRRAFAEAQRILDRWPDDVARASGPDLAVLYAWIALHAGDAEGALDALEDLADRPGLEPIGHWVLGRAYFERGLYGKGARALERWLEVSPAPPRRPD